MSFLSRLTLNFVALTGLVAFASMLLFLVSMVITSIAAGAIFSALFYGGLILVALTLIITITEGLHVHSTPDA